MPHPILPFMPSLFVPVPVLKTATEWYSDLLGRQITPQHDGDGIYIFDMDGAHLILDGGSFGAPPRIMFAADDIDAAHAVCRSMPHEELTEPFTDEYVSVFLFDGLMVCKAHQDLSVKQFRTNMALGKITHILAHADDLDGTVSRYETLVARKAEPDAAFGNLPCIRMDRGPDLLFDDNRFSRDEGAYYGRLDKTVRANPAAVIEATDLEAALAHVRVKGAEAVAGIETRLGVKMFQFRDPYGNAFAVREADKG